MTSATKVLYLSLFVTSLIALSSTRDTAVGNLVSF